MAFVIIPPYKHTPLIKRDVSFSISKRNEAILRFYKSAIDLIDKMGVDLLIGDYAEFHFDKEKNEIGIIAKKSDFSLKLSKYGHVGSNYFQVHNKNFKNMGLLEGNYKIEEPKKSQMDFDIILKPVEIN
ncbi:MAG: hypothetical protein ACSHW0_15900 [Thalassotalea sp.]